MQATGGATCFKTFLVQFNIYNLIAYKLESKRLDKRSDNMLRSAVSGVWQDSRDGKVVEVARFEG